MTAGRWQPARDAFARDWWVGVADIRGLLRSPGLHAALWLCVPALVVGAALRLHLCLEAPYGYFLSDTRNFIDAARDFLESPLSVFGVATRTFLASILYSVPVALDIPLLRAVPWGQHAVGMGMIVLAGMLCAAWLRHWRWWIVPVTLVVAAHPTLLWYEHMALPESLFVALSLAVAASVALFQRHPSPPALLILLAAIFLTAGARQEGFLYALAAVVAVVVAFHRDGRRLAAYLGAVGLFIFVTTRASRTTQGGQLLITSLIHYAPDRLWLTPDYSGRATALRDRFGPKWPIYPCDHNSSRKAIIADVKDFLIGERGLPELDEKRANNAVCKRVAYEIAIRRWWILPGMAYYKWLGSHLEPPSHLFEAAWPIDYALNKTFENEGSKEIKYLRSLFGREYRDAETFGRDLAERYYPEAGLGMLRRWQEAFARWSLWPHDEARVPIEGPPGAQQPVPRLPWLYPLGLSGLLCAAWANPSRRAQILTWVGILAAMWFSVNVVGCMRSRYRLAFEPYWYIGLAGIMDAACVLGRAARERWQAARRVAESGDERG